MAEHPAWLDAMAGRVRCLTCGGGYEREALRLVGQRDDGYWIVVCACHTCGTECMAAVLVSTVGMLDPSSVRPRPLSLTHDDVLSAHEILTDYTGGVEGLFGAGRSRERRG